MRSPPVWQPSAVQGTQEEAEQGRSGGGSSLRSQSARSACIRAAAPRAPTTNLRQQRRLGHRPPMLGNNSLLSVEVEIELPHSPSEPQKHGFFVKNQQTCKINVFTKKMVLGALRGLLGLLSNALGKLLRTISASVGAPWEILAPPQLLPKYVSKFPNHLFVASACRGWY